MTNKGKRKNVINEWENNDSGILRACSIYKKLGPLFFHIYSLTCLNKDTSPVKSYKYLNKFISIIKTV